MTLTKCISHIQQLVLGYNNKNEIIIKPEFVDGESHQVKGKRYLLKVIPQPGAASVSLNGTKELILEVKPDADRTEKARVLKEWYRKNLKAEIPELLTK